MAGTRRSGRRPRDEIRREAIAAAREILVTDGPSRVTLVAVAERLERSHSNIIHHFGSAGGLQAALMSAMVEDLARAMTKALESLGPGEERARILVDAVFDVFDAHGAAVLAAWIVLSNKQPYLDPVRDAVSLLAQKVDAHRAQDIDGLRGKIPSLLLFLALCAFGDALIGAELCRILGREPRSSRDMAVALVPTFF